MENIRICRIQVKKLFGNINYDIDMTENKRVSIITAPNGRGKTTILNLISFLFDPRYDTFNMIRSIPFDEFVCCLSNGREVILRQIKRKTEKIPFDAGNIPRTYKDYMEKRAGNYFKYNDYEFFIRKGQKRLYSFLFSDVLKDTVEMDPSEYLDESVSNRYDNHGYKVPVRSMLNHVWKTQKNYLKKENCALFIKYIKADRIQPVLISPRNMREFEEPRQESPLAIASERISEYIKKAIEEYNEAVSQAKDKLPQMFLYEEGSHLTEDEFIKGWNDYQEELNQFREIGLITSTEDFIKRKDISLNYDEKGPFLSTYLSAFKDTTEPLRDIYNRMNLFKQIIDERNRITGKKIEFGKQGITLLSNGKELPLDTLSSGEKHDFIMFYDLIFNIKDHGIVLVDEPEISLHIEWQESYLDRLLDICGMINLQAIVATHSPNIVSGHYDLLVDKGETNEY